MANQITLKVTLDDKGAVSGVRKITSEVEGLRKADAGLKWEGTRDGARAAKDAGDGYTTLKNVMANLASQGIAMAAGALKDMAASVVEIGSTFESSMSKVAALSGATGDQLGQLEAKARELGASTTFSASQAADALGYMALAGWDTEQMLAGVGSVLTLAQAGEMDLAAASDLVTDYLSAFNMEAGETARMVDVLAYAQANANTSVEGLGMAFKNCAANANAAGMDVETTSAAIAMMANQGLKGSEAGTALNAVLRDMTAKMRDGAIAVGDQSVAVMDAEGNYRDFADILADVEAATDGMGEAEKAAALQSTFTADSIKGLNLMLNAGADELSGFRDELYDSAGAGEEMARVMTDNLGGDLAAMGSAFEELALKVYDGVQEPLRQVVQFVTGSVVPAAEAVVAHAEYVGIALAGVGAAVAALNFGKITSTLSAVPKLLAGFTGGPILAVVAAITALAAGAKWAYDSVEPFRQAVDLLGSTVMECAGMVAGRLGEALSGVASGPLPSLSDIVSGVVVPALTSLAGFIADQVVPAVVDIAIFVADNVVPALASLADFVLNSVVPAFTGFAGFLLENVVPALMEVAGFVAGTVVPAVAELAGWFGENVLPILQAFADFVLSTVLPPMTQLGIFIGQNIIPAVMMMAEAIGTAMAVIQGVWEAAWGVVSSVIELVWGNVKAVVETTLGVLQGIIQVVTAAISGDWKGVWEGIGQVFSSIVNGILQIGANVINGLASVVTSVITGLYNTWARIWNAVSSVAMSVWGAISSTVVGTVTSIVDTAVSTFWGFVSTVQGIFEGVKNAIVNPIETAKGLVKGIIDAIGGFFSNFKIKLPHINLPHFAINPPGWQIGDLLQGKIPTLGIDWYATGGVFAAPSVIGVGEAGAEAVLPLTNRRAMADVGQAIGEAGGLGMDEVVAELRALRRELPKMMEAYCLRALTVNRREFARLVRESEAYL
ncbi:phage tail tape measure protein [Enterorhabdus sp. P55]|uniref:phage tail tape measure protein n=1 Tax=Enterorhabdus sp. P55 TaxID=2304571 RepID=UPI00136FD816|nr:phage tail tape measure protein [Enterorhabdus sp. P55]